MSRGEGGAAWTPARVQLALGAAGVVLGGIVAAFTGPMGWAKGSWAGAYLVLVAGVAQYVMGWMRGSGGQPRAWVQIGGWNLGGLLVIGGTLAGQPLLVGAGSVLLVVALALALQDSFGEEARDRNLSAGSWLAYRGMLLVLVLSIPVGMLLSILRN